MGLQKLMLVCALLRNQPSSTIIPSLSIWRFLTSAPPVLMEESYGLATSWLGDRVNSLNSFVPLVDCEVNLR